MRRTLPSALDGTREAQLPLGAVAGRWSAPRGRRGRPPGRGSSRAPRAGPRAAAWSSRPSGMPGPSSRTVTSTASGTCLEQHPRRRVGRRRGARRCRGRPTTTATSSRTVPAGRRTGVPGVATETTGGRTASSRLQLCRPGRAPARSPPWCGTESCAPDQRPQRALLLPGQPAEVGDVTAELGAAALHQRQHLQHPVVHRARQPGALRRGGRGPLGAVALGGHLLQRLAHVADDRAADQQQEDVAVVGLGDVLADRQVGRRPGRRRRPARPRQR